MRVVYLSASGQLGGAERCLLDLLACLRATQPDWALHVVLGADGPLRERAAALGASSTLVAFPGAVARLGESGGPGPLRLAVAALTAPGYLRRLRRALRDLVPDVVHSNGLKMHVLAGLAAPRRVPVIWHLHDFVSRRPITRRLLRFQKGRCAAVVTNSAGVAADARQVLGRARIQPVLNGVDLDAFTPSGPTLDLDRLAGLPPAAAGVVRVGLISTMARWKGHELFLRALAQLPPSTPPVRGFVVGGAIYQTAGSEQSLPGLRREAQRLGLAERVGFTGFVDDAAAAMRALDVVVHASTAPEPFGLVVAEAMACGRPVVLSAASGVAERLVPERDALLYPPGDAAALALAIARLAADAHMRAKLREQARDVAVACFDRRRFAREIAAVYREVVAA